MPFLGFISNATGRDEIIHSMQVLVLKSSIGEIDLSKEYLHAASYSMKRFLSFIGRSKSTAQCDTTVTDQLIAF